MGNWVMGNWVIGKDSFLFPVLQDLRTGQEIMNHLSKQAKAAAKRPQEERRSRIREALGDILRKSYSLNNN